MYLEKAVTRINKINWDNIGKLGDGLDGDLAYEYLRRTAKFYEKSLIKPYPPFYLDVVKVLGYKFGEELFDMDRSRLLPDHSIKNLSVTLMMLEIVKGYLKLSKFLDENPCYTEYLEIYDPLIRILERGGRFQYKDGGIMVQNSGLFPLYGWYEKFLGKEPIDISNI